MDYHHHARLTIHSRELLAKSVIEGRMGLKEAAASFKLSRQSAAKWVARFRAHGAAGLADRSSRPRSSPRHCGSELVERVTRLRRERWTGVRIAQATGLSRATVSRILRRLKLNRAAMLEPAPPVVRYEHPAPGDLLHLDIKKLGRIAKPGHRVTGDPADRHRGGGWEYVHVAIDDHSRIAFSAIYPDEKQHSVIAFLYAAQVYYARLGIRFRAILTDNGPAYRSRALAAVCRDLGLKQRFTRPYTPRTNGKAERFIQTAIREWAYVRAYQNSSERTDHLLPWIHQYNWHRPHAALNHKPPISRLAIDDNNLLTLHS